MACGPGGRPLTSTTMRTTLPACAKRATPTVWPCGVFNSAMAGLSPPDVMTAQPASSSVSVIARPVFIGEPPWRARLGCASDVPCSASAAVVGRMVAAGRHRGGGGGRSQEDRDRSRGLRVGEARREPLDDRDDGIDLGRRELLLWQHARAGQPLDDTPAQVVVGWQLHRRSGADLVAARREVARRRCEPGGGGASAVALCTVADRAVLVVDLAAERGLGGGGRRNAAGGGEERRDGRQRPEAHAATRGRGAGRPRAPDANGT